MPDVFIEHHPVHHVAPERKRDNPAEKIVRKNLRQHKVNIFSTFVRDPLGVALAEQHEDEHILLFIRRAFITNVPWLFFTLFLMITPFLFFPLIAPLNLPFSLIKPEAVLIFAIFYYVIIIGFGLVKFLTWFYDIGIVTEKRAVDIDFYDLSFVSVATARAQDLKDVRYVQRGFFESLFDYGDVALAVEASSEVLTFENSPHPAEIVSTLSALIGGHGHQE